MSRREVRPSTREASDRQKGKSLLKKNSAESEGDVVHREPAVHVEEGLQLVEYTAPVRESAGNSEASVLEEGVSFDETSNERLDEEEARSEEETEYLDPLCAVKSPQKCGAEPPAGSSKPRSNQDNWSVCNQFFPPNCVLTPYRKKRQSNLSSISLNFSPVLNLSSVIEEEVFSAAFDNSAFEEVTNRQNRLLSIEYIPFSTTMDEETYKDRRAVARKGVKRVKRLIDDYSPGTVSVADANVYQNFLADIRKSHTQCQDTLDELIEDLDDTNEVDLVRISQLELMSDELAKYFRDNDKAVKDKFADYEVSRPLSVAEKAAFDDKRSKEEKDRQKELKSAEEKKEKTVLKIQNAVRKFKDLNRSVSKVKATSEMSEQEIREHLQESKKWEKKVEDFTSAKETIEQELVGVDGVDEVLKEELNKEFDEVIELVSNKMEYLALTDKDLGLHTLSPNKVKENIIYPDPFRGGSGDNVYKFVKDFRSAMDADHVRKSDQIKTLRKHLIGEARHVVGEHQKSLDEALAALTERFGNSRLILEKLNKEFLDEYGQVRKWGKHGTQTRLTAIDKTQDYIRKLHDLADDHPELTNEVYSNRTLTAVAQGMPRNTQVKLSEMCKANDSAEDFLIRIFEELESMKRSNQTAAATGIGAGKDDNFDSESVPERKNKSRFNNFNSKGRHNCKRDKACKDEWDLLGCIKLYKLNTLEERIKYLYELFGCHKCGGPKGAKFWRDHECSWSDGKLSARCTAFVNNEQCKSGSALCKEHNNNASTELRSWLSKNQVKFTVGMIISSRVDARVGFDAKSESAEALLEDFVRFSSAMQGSDQEKMEAFNNYRKGKTSSPCESEQITREKLQSGEASQMMTDDEVADLFTNDMRKLKSSPSINPIPKGEPVFIFCIFEGRKGPIQAFIDSGANCWLALDGVPQEELVSAKLDSGPIPLGVASGMVTFAEAEWASLLPLADGTHQCVRGLTMKRVTGDMPKLNLVPAFEAIKSKCKKSSRIQNLKVPRMVGGEVKMIIGIKYQNIFPVPIHSLPNGLTVFESKLKPTAPGMLACIGGPVEALEHLCGITDTTSTMTYMASLVQNIKNFKPRVDFFPSSYSNEFKPYGKYSVDDDSIFEDPR